MRTATAIDYRIEPSATRIWRPEVFLPEGLIPERRARCDGAEQHDAWSRVPPRVAPTAVLATPDDHRGDRFNSIPRRVL